MGSCSDRRLKRDVYTSLWEAGRGGAYGMLYATGGASYGAPLSGAYGSSSCTTTEKLPWLGSAAAGGACAYTAAAAPVGGDAVDLVDDTAEAHRTISG